MSVIGSWSEEKDRGIMSPGSIEKKVLVDENKHYARSKVR
jgi:hypothetical protein